MRPPLLLWSRGADPEGPTRTLNLPLIIYRPWNFLCDGVLFVFLEPKTLGHEDVGLTGWCLVSWLPPRVDELRLWTGPLIFLNLHTCTLVPASMAAPVPRHVHLERNPIRPPRLCFFPQRGPPHGSPPPPVGGVRALTGITTHLNRWK